MGYKSDAKRIDPPPLLLPIDRSPRIPSFLRFGDRNQFQLAAANAKNGRRGFRPPRSVASIRADLFEDIISRAASTLAAHCCGEHWRRSWAFQRGAWAVRTNFSRLGGDGRADDNGESRPDERAMTPRARRKISPTTEERKEEWNPILIDGIGGEGNKRREN